VGPVSAIAVLFILWPIVDTLSQAWPMQLGNPAWRYGAIGLGANYLISALFGLLALSVAAAFGARRRTLRVLAAVEGVVAVLLLVVAVGFLLDALQVRRHPAERGAGQVHVRPGRGEGRREVRGQRNRSGLARPVVLEGGGGHPRGRGRRGVTEARGRAPVAAADRGGGPSAAPRPS